MSDLQKMDITALVDLLSFYTAQYTKMMSEGCTQEEYNACKNEILSLQLEIEARHSGRGNPVSNRTENFTGGE